MKEILKAMLLTSNQYFYSKNTALKIEVSKNGIFIEIANATGKNGGGNTTFGWRGKEVQDSEIIKLSQKEVLHLKELITTFFSRGQEAFEKKSQLICKKKQYEMFHDDQKGKNKIISLTPYKQLLYLRISASKERKLSFPITFSEHFPIVKFMDYAVVKSYDIETALSYLESIEKKEKGK